MKKIIEFLVKVVFSIVALIALIPTQIIRMYSMNMNAHIYTKNKVIDFIIGLMILVISTIGLWIFSQNLLINLVIMPTEVSMASTGFWGMLSLTTAFLFMTVVQSCYLSILDIKEKFWNITV